MKKIILPATAACLAMLAAQPSAAALVTLAFDGTIGPFTTPAMLAGGNFDGTIRFDDATPFRTLPATLMVANGSLAGTYMFGAKPGSFVPSAYQVTYNDTAFRFTGTSDEGASLTLNLSGSGDGFYSGTFGFGRGSDFSAVGNATIGTPGGVPEAATWVMMIFGFGAIGYSSRRQRLRSGLLSY